MNDRQLKSITIATASVIAAGALLLLKNKKTIPDGAVAVKPFNIHQYMGKWYEIARLDFRFEKNMNNTTAEYSLQNDGTVKVVNRGFDTLKNKWKQSIGKAKFIDDTTEAKLKVSFFGPFYAGYNVIAIDPEYKYALIAGRNFDYMWILSRQKNIPENIKHDYLAKAKKIGYDVDKLVWVSHD